MRKGVRLSLGALLVLVPVVLLVVSMRTAPGAATGPAPAGPNGIAILYVPGPFDENYAVAADMRLPRAPRNGSWYCVWLMLVDKERASRGAPFVQGGLMRWERHAYDLTAFIADAKRGRPLAYDDVGTLGDGWHHVELRGTATAIDLLVDGARVHRFDRSAYLGDAEDVYLQIGAEVVRDGDSIEASVRNVRVKRDDDAALHDEPIACVRYDRGLHFDDTRDGFEARGRFTSRGESGYEGCANFSDDAER